MIFLRAKDAGEYIKYLSNLCSVMLKDIHALIATKEPDATIDDVAYDYELYVAEPTVFEKIQEERGFPPLERKTGVQHLLEIGYILQYSEEHDQILQKYLQKEEHTNDGTENA